MIAVLIDVAAAVLLVVAGLGILFAIADRKAAALYLSKVEQPRRLELPDQDAGEILRKRDRVLTRWS